MTAEMDLQKKASVTQGAAAGVACGALLAAPLLLLCLKNLFPHVAGHYLMPALQAPYVLLLAAGVVAVACCFLFSRRLFRQLVPGKWLVVSISMAFSLLQMFLVYNYYFETDWDVQQLVGAARAAAFHGREAASGYRWYFSECPNNLFLTSLFMLVFKTGALFGTESLFPLLALQCLLFGLVSLMFYQTLLECCKDAPTAFSGYLFFLLFTGLSPWISIPYSDVWSLFFSMGIVWLALTGVLSSKPLFKRCLFVFVSVLAYAVKPQLLLVALAVVSVRLSDRSLSANFRANLFRAKPAASLAASLFFALLAVSLAGKSTGISPDRNSAFGMTHYLLIGMNSRTIGDYAPEDVEFSRNYSDRASRAKAELAETGRRVYEMGLPGFCRHWCEKSILTYGDGTFSWGKEGTFFHRISPEKNSTVSPFLRSCYYTAPFGGSRFPWLLHAATLIWLGILFFSMIGAFFVRGRAGATVSLALLLILLFELLFECRARYLFGFTPLYMLAACMGLHVCFSGDKIKKG